MSNENELLEPLATEAGQLAIVRAINNLSSLEYAVRAERAATNAALSADEALNSANDASDSATEARNWATKTDGYVAQETITIPPEQEGDDPTTETIDLYSARYYAALALDIYNNLQFDSVPTENSTALVSSGAIYTALNGKADKFNTYTKTEVDTALSNVQGQLTFDSTPTANSQNPVTSGGIKTALDGKQDSLTFDSTPTANSTNPVTSGGIYTALQNVNANIEVDDEITEDSDNPVTSAAIYAALLNFTPSGGGGGAGNASGVQTTVLYENANGWSSGNITLGDSLDNYDLIEILSRATSHTNDKKSINIALSKEFVVGLYFDVNEYDNRYIRFLVYSNTQLNFILGESLCITKITGIKFGRYVSGVAVDTTVTQNSNAVVTSGAVYNALLNYTPSGGGTTYTAGDGIDISNDTISLETASANNIGGIKVGNGLSIDANGVLSASDSEDDFESQIPLDMYVSTANEHLYKDAPRDYYKVNSGYSAAIFTVINGYTRVLLVSDLSDNVVIHSTYNSNDRSTVYSLLFNGKTYYYSLNNYGYATSNSTPSDFGNVRRLDDMTFLTPLLAAEYVLENIIFKKTLSSYHITDAYTKTEVDSLIQNAGGSSITVDSTITQNGTNPVEGGAIYTALENKADKSITYTKTEVDTAVASKGDVTTNTDQNITGTKTFVGSKKVGFKQSAANDKLGFTLFGNTGTERGYLEFNPTNTVDGVAGLMTLGNYATSAAGLTQVGFRRYSNISGASGAYNLLMPMVADAKTPFSLTTSYQNFYLPLGFTDGTTTVKTAKSGLVDLSPLLASLEARIAALEGN